MRLEQGPFSTNRIVPGREFTNHRARVSFFSVFCLTGSPTCFTPLRERLLYRVGRPNCHPLRTVGAGSLDRVLMQSMRPCRAAVRRENTGQVTHSPLGVLLRHRVHLDPDIEGCGVD